MIERYINTKYILKIGDTVKPIDNEIKIDENNIKSNKNIIQSNENIIKLNENSEILKLSDINGTTALNWEFPAIKTEDVINLLKRKIEEKFIIKDDDGYFIKNIKLNN